MGAEKPADHPTFVFRHLETKYTELENALCGWLNKQSFPVAAAGVTFNGAAQGAAVGGIMGTLFRSQGILPFLAGGPIIVARNVAVLAGADAGISYVMRRFTGKQDIQTSMVAAFGSGVMCNLVSASGVAGPKRAAFAIINGSVYALIWGGLVKVGEHLAKPPADDVYRETRSMLSRLYLESYEKNFKNGLLNDRTLPLLNDSVLRDASIPPGPRLLILDHIQRNQVANGGGRRS